MKLLSSVALACSTAAAVASAADVVVNSVADDFHWADPFGAYPTPPGYEATCEATRTFKARQHSLAELHEPEPAGLKPWSKALKYFFGGRPFPGSWDGVDRHGTARDVVLMSYADVPGAVKAWIQEKKAAKDTDAMWLYGVYHKDLPGIKIKGTATPRPRPTAAPGQDAELDAEAARLPPDEDLVVLFAAGAIYHNLPLWVAEGSACEGEMRDLAKYGASPRDGGVVGWVVERTEPDTSAGGSREMTFKVKAQVLKETEQGRTARLAREKEEAEAEAAAPAESKAQEAGESATSQASSAESVKDEL